MKKIIFALAVLCCCVQFADAQQTKSPDALKKAVESAESAVAKKPDSVNDWVKVGSAYLDVVSAAYGDVGENVLGMNRQELTVLLRNDKPQSTENVTIEGNNYTKEVFATRTYYYDDYEILQIIELKPIYPDAIDKALAAYTTAYEQDVKGSKTKDITTGMGKVKDRYFNEGVNNYLLRNLDVAGVNFEKAYNTSMQEPYNTLDSLSLYNTALIAFEAEDFQRAKTFYEKAVAIGYYLDGDTIANLGTTLNKLGENERSKQVLEDGFVKFPENQGILYGLINYYLTADEGFDRLFSILDQAKANDPGNVIFYYVEGNIHSEIGDTDAAIAAYKKAIEVDPTYEYGYIGLALVYAKMREELAQAADEEEDNDKYDQLVKQFDDVSLTAAEYFEQAFEITKSNDTKISLAQYLKDLYFRYRDRDPKYSAAYEKYNNVYNNGL